MDELPVRGPGARALVSGTALLFAARLLTAGLALVQTILLASIFGTSASTDAYFVASAVSLMFAGPIETVLNMAFQPVYVHAVESEGQAAAWRIAAGLFRVGLFLTGLLSVVIIALSPWVSVLVAPGFDAVATAQAAQIIRVTAPIIFFIYAALGDWIGTAYISAYNRTGATVVRGQCAMADILGTQGETTS